MNLLWYNIDMWCRKDEMPVDNVSKNKLEAIKLIADKIIQTTYKNLLLELRFIDVALAQLKPEASVDVAYLATNGKTVYYNQIELVRKFHKEPNRVTHDIMHLLLHCVFKHIFLKNTMLTYWNLACDITVEQLISTIKAPCIKVHTPEKIKKLQEIENVVDQFTPHNVMTYLQLKNLKKDDIEALESLFHVDEHDLWGKTSEIANKGGELRISITAQELEKLWSNVSRAVELNLSSFYKKQGDIAGNLQQKLKQINREPYDYSRFLKKFSQIQEVTKVNQDEFDYIFYTYGLSMYDNMPLIEPLEYKDCHTIKDFVIAIDTSGSTSGEIVQKFLEKTYNILKTMDGFAERMNLYIIQCDAQIQEVAHIKSQFELDDYIKNFTIKGLGGTDFRPVFGYIRKLLEEKVFQNLKGMIYFTDGYGTFPAEKTPYDTAFVFVVPEDYEQVTVPPWAIKVLLTEQEIIEFKKEKEV